MSDEQKRSRTDQFAQRLQVSPIAARYRLDQLGLIDRPGRCPWPPDHIRSQSPRRPLLRQGERQ
jgi:hypothetical protein